MAGLTQDENCLDEQIGNLCLYCKPGFTKVTPSAECSECPSDGTMGFVTFIVVLWVFALGVYILNLSFKDQSSSLLKLRLNRSSYMKHNVVLGVTKVIISHFQIVGLLLLVNVGWKEYLGVFFSFSQAISVSGLDWADCLLKTAGGNLGEDGSSLYATGIIVAVLPWFLLFVLALVLYCAGKVRSAEPMSSKDIVRRLYLSFLVFMMLLNVLFIRTGLNFFACTEEYYATLPESEERPSILNVLISEPYIECVGDEYSSWAFGLGLILLVVIYGLGTFAFTAFQLLRIGGVSKCCKSKEYGDSLPERLSKWGPKLGVLFRCYRGHLYYWSIFETFITFILVVVLVLMQLQGAKQLLAGLIVVTIALVLQVKAQPYIAKEVNSLKTWSLVSIFFSFSLGAFLIPEDGIATGFGYGSKIDYDSISGLILAIHLFFIFYAFLVILDVYSMDQNGKLSAMIKSFLRMIRWRKRNDNRRNTANVTENSRKVEMLDDLPQKNVSKGMDRQPPSPTELGIENGQPSFNGSVGGGSVGSSTSAASNNPNKDLKPLKSALKNNGRYIDAVTANSEKLTLNSEKVDLQDENFIPGERIRITNLSRMQEFNGKEGSFRDFFPEKRRYEVLLDDGSILRIRRKHFIRLELPKPTSEEENQLYSSGQGSGRQRAPSMEENALIEKMERMNKELSEYKADNSKLKKEVKYLNAVNSGIVDGYQNRN